MARPREFDTHEALGRAMNVFRQKGYRGASLDNLLEEMGIGKGSFYATFGSKRELFRSALRHFGETQAIFRLAFPPATPAREAIASMLDRVIERAVHNKRACLFAKTALEFCQSDPDPEVAELVADGVKRLEDTYCQLVVRGQGAGEISTTRGARTLARFLTGIHYGLQVMASANPNRKTLKDIASTALASLDPVAAVSNDSTSSSRLSKRN